MANAGGRILASDVSPPDPVGSSSGVAVLASAAATYALLPTSVAVSVTNPRSDKDLLTEVLWGAWMQTDTAELRLSLRATGGNTWTEGTAGPGLGANGPLTYSENLIICGPNGTNTYMTLTTGFTFLIPAGTTTTLTVYAYRSVTTGTNHVNYAKLRMVPLRYT
jgi:hypothetical protein